MPFIAVNTSCTLTKAQKDDIKTNLGKLIEILPTKSEKGLMVDICDNHSLYFAGNEMEKAAFVDLRLFKESPFESKREFYIALCKILDEVAGIEAANVYFNAIELQNWGSRGDFRQ